MKNALSFFTFLIIFSSTSLLHSQTLDEVLNSHFAAIGQQKLRSVESVVTTGSLNEMGVEIPFRQTSMRPGYLRLEGTFQGMTFVQTYNGKEGWYLNPFTGSTVPDSIAGAQLKDLEIQADLDGMLWNWKEKGYDVVLDSTENVEGADCFRVVVKTVDGDTYTQYINTKTFLVVKTKTQMKTDAANSLSESYYSNYIVVDGISFPGRIDNKYNGVTGESIVIQKIELNVAIDTAIFGKPASN